MSVWLESPPTGNCVHIMRFDQSTYCGCNVPKRTQEATDWSYVADPYGTAYATDRYPCSRCAYNLNLERRKEAKMLSHYGFEVPA